MKHILVVVHGTEIQNYLTFLIKQLAVQANHCIWLEINTAMQPIKVIKWSKLEQFTNKRNPVFRKDPLELIKTKEIIREHENVNWKNESLDNIMDWIVLEDRTISLHQYSEMSRNGFIALDFNKEQVMQESLQNKKITVSYQYKSISETTWKKFSIQLGVEKGFKNNYDKILWNFSLFIPSLLGHDFEVTQEKELEPIKKLNRITIEIANLTNQVNLVLLSIKRKCNTSRYNWKIGFEKDEELRFLKQPSNSYWADPFFIEHNGIKVVFFEELDHYGKGKIAAVVIDDFYEIIEKRVVIEEDFHLSFPNIFFENDRLLMIPESTAVNAVLLYQCDHFPFHWSEKKKLVENVKLTDIVWTKNEDTYWVFANKIEDFEYDNNERLYLYSTLDLTSGNWKPHSQNPIVTNKGSARNAGKILNKKDKIIRVSQNCESSYGANLVFQEIETLTPDIYKEKYLYSKFPNNLYFGQHTFNEGQNEWIVSDFLIKE
jgi:hypothetical protein